MKVIVAGGRNFEPNEAHETWLIEQLRSRGASEIVCGMASGADEFGRQTALELGLPVKEFPALWGKFGAAAGPHRNIEMTTYADLCILFPGGKGTAHMHHTAEKYGLEAVVFPDDTQSTSVPANKG